MVDVIGGGGQRSRLRASSLMFGHVVSDRKIVGNQNDDEVVVVVVGHVGENGDVDV